MASGIDPLRPGAVGPEVALRPAEVQALAVAAAPAAAGLPEPPADPPPDRRPGAAAGVVVWSQADNELLVAPAKIEVRLDEGIVVVRIPVYCDQAPQAVLTVGFAVGERRRPAGLLAVTEDRPRGPADVVDVWGDAVTAFAWQVLLSVATGVAAGAGLDTDGAPLIPAALRASADELRILTMARHPFDRAGRSPR
jgi:hypothetical protein